MTSLEMEATDINLVQTHIPKEDVDDAVFLSWKDLWVTVRDGRHGSWSILQGLTAYAQPGELLAIMGRSGCGKSTLLDALAVRDGRHGSRSILQGLTAYAQPGELLAIMGPSGWASQPS
ncbi:hypothetical protein GH714_007897 [Hevea brasiliensis]|uniref:ABC transporter domain-containing protein n=1 Tax=Hevea brasiliensis TaxID=3981 RepID=A0A6A6L1H5_HEVBR|nr:hypothetical protein GH714_007897 [Hevea brasiliensis]